MRNDNFPVPLCPLEKSVDVDAPAAMPLSFRAFVLMHQQLWARTPLEHQINSGVGLLPKQVCQASLTQRQRRKTSLTLIILKLKSNLL